MASVKSAKGGVHLEVPPRIELRRTRSCLDRCLEQTADLAFRVVTPEILVDG